jgi:vitamin-K-epoxide reductase (warfarin-sensitive)
MPLKILATIGFFLSLYAFYIKNKYKKDPNYIPLCNLNKNISCTKAFSSSYSNIFYLPNSLYGILFYVLIFLLASLNLFNYIFPLSIISVLISLYLAYLLYFKVKSLCLICTSTYLINLLLLFFSLP